jgi:hypothetical protein
MRGDGRVDQVAAKPPQTSERAVLVSSGEPSVAYDVRHQDRSELAGLGHWTLRLPTM